MESITIRISTGNAAFDEAPASEIARILRDLASRIEDASVNDGDKLHDANGNTVGTVRIVAEPE